jgi:hypothetical protein
MQTKHTTSPPNLMYRAQQILVHRPGHAGQDARNSVPSPAFIDHQETLTGRNILPNNSEDRDLTPPSRLVLARFSFLALRVHSGYGHDHASGTSTGGKRPFEA